MTSGERQTRLQREIETGILRYIRENRLQKGDRLPSQEELSSILEVSRVALREALARLESKRIIRQVHGIGTFLANDPKVIQTQAVINLSLTEVIQSQGMVPGTSDISVSRVPFPVDVIDANVDALCIKRVRTADGESFAYNVAYIRTDTEGLPFDPEAYRGSIWQALASCCGKSITRSEAVIEADVADEEVSEKLGIPIHFPVLVMHQQQFDQDDQILIVSTDYFVQRKLYLHITRFRPGSDIVYGGIQ